MPKGYWKASGQFLKGIGKSLGNTQISAVSQWEEVELPNCPAAIGKNVAISVFSSELQCFCLFLLKVEKAVETF